jgi:hypothetical protein
MKEAPECARPRRMTAMRPYPERADPVSTEMAQPQREQATQAQRADRADRAKAEPERVEPQAVEVQRAGRRGVVVERA